MIYATDHLPSAKHRRF